MRSKQPQHAKESAQSRTCSAAGPGSGQLQLATAATAVEAPAAPLAGVPLSPPALLFLGAGVDALASSAALRSLKSKAEPAAAAAGAACAAAAPQSSPALPRPQSSANAAADALA